MRPAVDVERLPRHEIAFGDHSKSTVPDPIVFYLRALEAALLGADLFVLGIDLVPDIANAVPSASFETVRRVDSNSLAFYDPIQFGHLGRQLWLNSNSRSLSTNTTTCSRCATARLKPKA